MKSANFNCIQIWTNESDFEQKSYFSWAKWINFIYATFAKINKKTNK